jgi:hypothetical protein
LHRVRHVSRLYFPVRSYSGQRNARAKARSSEVDDELIANPPRCNFKRAGPQALLKAHDVAAEDAVSECIDSNSVKPA